MEFRLTDYNVIYNNKNNNYVIQKILAEDKIEYNEIDILKVLSRLAPVQYSLLEFTRINLNNIGISILINLVDYINEYNKCTLIKVIPDERTIIFDTDNVLIKQALMKNKLMR